MVFAYDKTQPLRNLPNQEGFKFIGVCLDDTLVECHIIKDAHGMHIVTGGASYDDLKGWKYKKA